MDRYWAMKTQYIQSGVRPSMCHILGRVLAFLQLVGDLMRGIEAGMGLGMVVRGNEKGGQKDDLAWSEVGEMAYGYLRIPLALVLVEIIYWWGTEPSASLEPLQVLLAWLWTGVSNLIWPGSAELVFHGPSQSWTGVNLIGSGFNYGEVPL